MVGVEVGEGVAACGVAVGEGSGVEGSCVTVGVAAGRVCVGVGVGGGGARVSVAWGAGNVGEGAFRGAACAQAARTAAQATANANPRFRTLASFNNSMLPGRLQPGDGLISPHLPIDLQLALKIFAVFPDQPWL